MLKPLLAPGCDPVFEVVKLGLFLKVTPGELSTVECELSDQTFESPRIAAAAGFIETKAREELLPNFIGGADRKLLGKAAKVVHHWWKTYQAANPKYSGIELAIDYPHAGSPYYGKNLLGHRTRLKRLSRV